MSQERLDPERIHQLLMLNADKLRELEQALVEAQKAMTMFAAVLASVVEYLPEEQAAPDNGDWQVLNRMMQE